MKNFRMLHFVMLVSLVLLLTAGCATTTTEDPTNQGASSSNGLTETDVKESVATTAADLTRVYFDFDSYVLSGETRAALKQNAMVLKAAPMLKVKIEGHCDERGSDDYNLALGEQRAQATKDYLRSLGVSASQMSTVTMGELEPLDPAGNEAAWAKNRRAEFKPM